MNRKNLFLILTLVPFLVAAGCAGTDINDTPAPTSNTSDGITETDSSGLSDDRAKEKAIAAEEQYISDKLLDASCISKGAPGGHGNVRASVNNRTETGTYVRVSIPYHYTKDDLEADGETNSLYFVTPEEVERISGEEVTLC